MKKIKTSISLEADHLARLKCLAESEHRSVSQLVELVLENILPILELDDEQFGRIAAVLDRAFYGTVAPAAPDIAFPKPERPGSGAAETTPALGLPQATLPIKARAGSVAKLRVVAK